MRIGLTTIRLLALLAVSAAGNDLRAQMGGAPSQPMQAMFMQPTGMGSNSYVDAYGLGSATDTSQPGIDVTATGSGSVEIEHTVFDGGDPLALRFNGSSTASLRDDLFRSNMRMPIGQRPEPRPAPESGTVPVIQIAGSSAAAKTFAGNNVGAAPVRFDHARDWTIGGDSDADATAGRWLAMRSNEA